MPYILSFALRAAMEVYISILADRFTSIMEVSITISACSWHVLFSNKPPFLSNFNYLIVLLKAVFIRNDGT